VPPLWRTTRFAARPTARWAFGDQVRDPAANVKSATFSQGRRNARGRAGHGDSSSLSATRRRDEGIESEVLPQRSPYPLMVPGSARTPCAHLLPRRVLGHRPRRVAVVRMGSERACPKADRGTRVRDCSPRPREASPPFVSHKDGRTKTMQSRPGASRPPANVARGTLVRVQGGSPSFRSAPLVDHPGPEAGGIAHVFRDQCGGFSVAARSRAQRSTCSVRSPPPPTPTHPRSFTTGVSASKVAQ